MNAGTQRCHLTQTRWLLINVARLRLANRLVELRYIHIVHRQRARGGCSHLLGNRVHNLRCYHHHKLCVGSLQLPRAEKISEHRNIADPWDLGEQFRGAVVQQASHAKALAVLQLDFGLRPAGGNGRDGKAVEDRGVGEIQRADLGCQLEPHHIPLDGPDKFQLYAKWLEDDRDRGATASPALHHRNRKFAAGQKLGGLAATRQQVRLRQDLRNVLLLRGTNGRTQIDVGPENENIQQVVERKAIRGARSDRTAASSSAQRRRIELLG